MRPGRPGGRIFVAALLLSALGAMLPSRIRAQEMELPVSIQVPLFLKVITFDRQRNQQADAYLVVGIAFQSGFRASSTARSDVERLLRGSSERKIRVVIIDLDKDNLSDVLQQQRVSLLYVSPLRAYNIADIASAASSARTTTVTGVSAYVEQGISVGARLQSDHPKLLVNRSAARRCGVDFTAELLKLAQVIE